MLIRLEKKNRKTTDFVEIETRNHILEIKYGKVRKSAPTSRTSNRGTEEKALLAAREEAETYKSKGYVEVDVIPRKRKKGFDGTFDKAKWHYGGDFPEELNEFQGYVHTGMYIAWMIENDMVDESLKCDLNEQIEQVRRRKMTGAQFFADYLDGVLNDTDLNPVAGKFSQVYYDNDKKNGYSNDYLLVFDSEDLLPSFYHVEDTWENYDKLKGVITKRFNDWSVGGAGNERKWWKLFRKDDL